LDRVSFAYPDGTRALEAVDLQITQRERVAVVGPNGAGKSTLLHILAALATPTSGTVQIMGQAATKGNAAQLRRHVGILFQDPDDQLFMPTVREDVAFGPMNSGWSREVVEERVQEAMAQVGIEGLASRAPHHLSLGEKKRVALAGLLAMRPDILLLDEPTANLDPQGRRDLIEILNGRTETIVIATHDLEVAFELADRGIVLAHTVLFDGDFRDLSGNADLLAKAQLELPSFSRLAMSLSGKERRAPPLSVEEAAQMLRCRADSD
jgi:cobalt/nickel transport system ATP-binding protein